MVMKMLEAISYHVYPHCATDTLLEASHDDKSLIFGSSQDGCGKQVQQGGVCIEHGARVKRSSGKVSG
jgi:hypothetical protein